jgi:hypothetical protein
MDSLGAHNSRAVGARRELDVRRSDGFDVRLWWDPVDDRLAVTVADSSTGLEFEVPVRDGEAPLDVFRHPFEYAAGRARGLRPGAAATTAIDGRTTARGAR